MREITSHRQINDCNAAIHIEADERDPENGNASHTYQLSWEERLAITKLEEAKHWLIARTPLARMARGVEGMHQP